MSDSLLLLQTFLSTFKLKDINSVQKAVVTANFVVRARPVSKGDYSQSTSKIVKYKKHYRIFLILHRYTSMNLQPFLTTFSCLHAEEVKLFFFFFFNFHPENHLILISWNYANFTLLWSPHYKKLPTNLLIQTLYNVSHGSKWLYLAQFKILLYPFHLVYLVL